MPLAGTLVSPLPAEVVSIFPGDHALVMKSAEGLELLLHIGLDTVDLNGKGFTPLVKDGDGVEVGQPLVIFDRQVISGAGKELHTAQIVTNKEVIGGYTTLKSGTVKAGVTQVFALRLKQDRWK